jgi:hypothetical protein
MAVGFGLAVGVGHLVALNPLLRALAVPQLLDGRIVAAHRRKDRQQTRPLTGRSVRYRARVISGKLLCAAAIAAAIAVAGCGSGKSSSTSSADFKAGFATSQREFRKLGTDIAKDITGAAAKTDAQLATEFGGLATRAGQQASQLATLKAPAKYSTRVTKLVAGFRAIKGDLSKIATAAKQHDAKSAEGATRALLTDAAKIKTADISLSKDLGLPKQS